MIANKTIAIISIIGIFFAFCVPSALAGGAGGKGDPIAWYFFLVGAFDASGKGSKATGRVTSYKPVAIGEPDSCEGADYPTYPNIAVELERGKSTELFFYEALDDGTEKPFCAAGDYESQVERLIEMLEASLGTTIYWKSIKSVAWNDSSPPHWEIFEFSATIPYE